MLKVLVECYWCGKQIESHLVRKERWYDPYYVWIEERGFTGWLQTVICPNCVSWFSLPYWLMYHKKPRLLHFLYASLLGYFWLPCPRCGTYFGGHESASHGFIDCGNGHGKTTCGCE